ncbi:MAG TPA: XdhC family protein [Candidatus Baltobacteraceae bacterium]|nr:XdhC family protein [Candidatus Baltobacteraceae bacterium]
MRDVFATAAAWLEEGRRFALATLCELRAAKPAPLGTTVAVDGDGRIAGNIGAGCYESEIIEAAQATLADGALRTLEINLDTDDELAGGTACGAVMRLLVWRPGIEFLDDAFAIGEGERAVRVQIGGFEHVFPAKQTLIVVGATALAADLAAIGRRMDLKIVVVDPRHAFATYERLPDANAIVREWPDEYLPHVLSGDTALIVLSHDPKFDLPALRCALRSPAPYIGLLGSRRAQAARRSALRAEGFDERALDRIHGPVGLDIGGTTTAETAISILAEIVATRSGRPGRPLLAESGAIH